MNKREWVILVFIVFLLVGCKSVHRRTDTRTTYPDGKVVNVVDEVTDESFTLGFSNGDSKVIDLLDVNVTGAGIGR